MKFIKIYIFIFLISLSVKGDQFDSRLSTLFDQLYSSKTDQRINNITKQMFKSVKHRFQLCPKT